MWLEKTFLRIIFLFLINYHSLWVVLSRETTYAYQWSLRNYQKFKNWKGNPPIQSGRFNPVFLHPEIRRYLLNRIIYLGYENIYRKKFSVSEFSLFMCVWASRWVSLGICTRMFGVYFTLCLPPGNAGWKTEAKKSPEFCHFPRLSRTQDPLFQFRTSE